MSRDGEMIRRTVYLDWEITTRLHEEARRRHLNEAQLVRQILRDHFGIE